MFITNMKYLVGFYQHEIPGLLLPKLDIWMMIANMNGKKYLDGYYHNEIPGCFLPTLDTCI